MISNLVIKFLKYFFNFNPKRSEAVSKLQAVWLSIGIVVTQLGDYFTTRYGLIHTNATEQNGYMYKFIKEYGMSGFLGLKLAASAFLIWTCWKRPIVSSILITLYVAVILNNLYVITR